jgi:primosomal protein N' (replication factor Y) (superfamily II helicase)
MNSQHRQHTPQGRLFEPRPAWEEDDATTGIVARVVLAGMVEKPLDYLVPEPLAAEVEPGRRLRVPLGRGNRPTLGYCVAVTAGELPHAPLKEILGVEDERPLLSPDMLELTKWMAERWMCRWGEVLEAVLPAGVRQHAGSRRQPLLARTAAAPPRKPTPPQARVLAAASEPLTAAALAERSGASRAVVARLVKNGLLAEVAPEPARPTGDGGRPERLSAEQTAALEPITDAIDARRHETVVLFGVTGSGKTEVYLRAVEETLRHGRQAIVLVPEISLTPQTCRRFRDRFGEVAVLHSHLTPAERHAQWRRIAAGEVGVVVGARSAVFAPAPRPGLFVIDEEHETSFKQGTAPRYHARDVAHWRARREGVPLVLGSATPALETFQKCLSGEWRLMELPHRVGGTHLPAVVTVDLRDSPARARGSISPRLAAGIRWALDAGGQVILLLNRRGFATHVQCQACGHTVTCPQCDLALTLHQPGSRGVCHGCGRVTKIAAVCGECGDRGLALRGSGTQRLEDRIARMFPGARVARMDTDTMRSRGSHERTLDAFRDRSIDILVGTQMIAKGLDFPAVMLVGVVHADAALHLADFRAAERTCQLVTQVAGRSGRGPQGGRVVVQTSTPEHPAIRAAAAHDYEAFVRSELPVREALAYPPFGQIIRVVVRSVDEAMAGDWAGHVADRLRTAVEAAGEEAEGMRVLGPAPAPIERLRDRWRFHVQIQGPDGGRLRQLVRNALQDLATPDRVAWIVDVDPVEML